MTGGQGGGVDGPVLVTGATGDVGGQVVRLLRAADVPVRAMYRHDSQRDALADTGAEPVRADFADGPSLAAAMRGCAGVFLLTPPLPGQADMERRAIDLAGAIGVPRLVRVSAADSNLLTRVPWAQAHAVADHHLARSGLNWTVLRPTAYMQNFAQQATTIKRGFLPQTTGDGEASWIDTADLAAVAARVLTEDGHAGATYFVTGPESLSVPEVARRFSDVLGRRVRYVQLPAPIYTAVLRLAGQSKFTAQGLKVQFADVVRAHLDVDTTYEVERLTGSPARSIDDWIRDNRALFD